jgi:hypothetical protein
MSPSMNTRLDRPTATGDPAVRAVLAATLNASGDRVGLGEAEPSTLTTLERGGFQ